MILTLPSFSQKLSSTIDTIEKETKRKVYFEQVPSVGLQGMNFAFRPHPTLINVLIVLPYAGSIDDFEQSIAHEATHGLLLYGKGYCHPDIIRQLTPSEGFTLNTLNTMIEDVAVNKIIEDCGFPPVGSVYFNMMRSETKAAKNRDISMYRNSGAPDQVSINRFMIFRYLLAWTSFRYYKLKLAEKKTINDFRKAFAQAYRSLDVEAKQIQRLFEENDILTPEGHEVIMKGVISLWGLDNAVILRRYVTS
jgi:hypothetical protein